jgi:putative hemolysin
MIYGGLLVALLLLASAFFSAAEIGVTMASRVRLRTQAQQGKRGAQRAERLLVHPERAIVTCLVGNTLVNVAIAAYVRAAVLHLYPFGTAAADALATAIVVPLALVFGEALPKGLAQTYPNRTLAALALPLRLVRLLLWPLTQTAFAVAGLVRRVTRMKPELTDFVSREELKLLVALSEKHGHVDPEERDLIYRIFEFWRLDPSRFVRPLESVPHAPGTTLAGEAKERMRAAHLGRLVVTDAAGQDVLGVVTATALVDAPNNAPLANYAHAPVSGQLGRGVDRLLADLQRSPAQLAVVRDPGGTGIVSLDDLLQHLLGRVPPEGELRLASAGERAPFPPGRDEQTP